MRKIEEKKKEKSEGKMTRKRNTKLEQLDATDTKETRIRSKLIDDSPQAPTGKSKIVSLEIEVKEKEAESHLTKLPPRKKSLAKKTRV